MITTVARAKITTPDGVFVRVRFVYDHDTNRYAVWEENRQLRTATLKIAGVAQGLDQGKTNRRPYTLHFSDESIWTIISTPGGGCGCKSAYKGVTPAMLLDGRTTIS